MIFHERVAVVFAFIVLAPLPSPAAPPLTVSRAWIRYLLPSLPAAGYLQLSNPGDEAAVLTGARSPDCAMLMLHKSSADSGTATMTGLAAITIPAHGSVSFAPSGYHLMCMQPQMHPGQVVPVTLQFQDGTALAIRVPVYGAQNAP